MTVNITFALFLLNLLLSATPSVFFTRELIGLSCCSPSLPFSLAVVFPSDAAFINFLYSDISILRRFSSSNWANLRCWTEGCSINKEFFNPYITGTPGIYMETNKVHEQIDATRIRSEEGFTWFRFLRKKKEIHRADEDCQYDNTSLSFSRRSASWVATKNCSGFLSPISDRIQFTALTTLSCSHLVTHEKSRETESEFIIIRLIWFTNAHLIAMQNSSWERKTISRNSTKLKAPATQL